MNSGYVMMCLEVLRQDYPGQNERQGYRYSFPLSAGDFRYFHSSYFVISPLNRWSNTLEIMKWLKYLACFIAALVSAAATYRTFFMFRSEAVFTPAIPLINTVFLMLVWAISFSAKDGFVRRNRIVLIAVPMLAIQISNLVTHLNNQMTSLSGFIAYLAASTSLVFFSYWSSVFEDRID